MELQTYLNFATELAYRAGRITLGNFNAGIQPEFKIDDTPVTAADRAAETFIRGEIERVYPKHAIVGEEFGASDDSAEIRWLIDPIDGTNSFMRGVPQFGVLIGLEISGQVKVGVAYFPGTDEMLSAGEGLGCWWNGRPARVAQISSLDRACACYTTYQNFERCGRKAAWDRIHEAFYQVRGWSDAYGYLLVATGRVEAMFDPIMNIWDCGPFPVILSEAGGYFGSWDGKKGHTHNEALATSQVLLPDILRLIA